MTPSSPYELLYELAGEQLLDPRWIAAGAALLLALLATWWVRSRRGRSTSVARFLALGVALMLAALAGSAWEERDAAQALQSQRARVVEGELSDHELQPRTRYDRRTNSHVRSVGEAFRVDGVAFGYVRGVTAPGFNNGGDAPIRLRNGERVRVHYVAHGGDDFEHRRIVRLERRPAAPRTDPADGHAASPGTAAPRR